jgi:hypothetical protein
MQALPAAQCPGPGEVEQLWLQRRVWGMGCGKTRRLCMLNDQPHPERMQRLKQREDARIHAARPRSAALRQRALDETHTQVVGAGRLTRLGNLQPDLVIAGKSIAAGVPFGVWGMSAELDARMPPRKDPEGAHRACACCRGRRT